MQKFINNFSTTLSADLSSVATVCTIPTADAAKLGTVSGGDYYAATLYNGTALEIVWITSVSGGNLTIARAKEGTSALAYVTGDSVEVRNTKGTYENFVQSSDLDTVDHDALLNTGTNTHTQIDSHIADDTIHGTGGGDVFGPASTTENYIPQWDATTKLLKDGKAIGTTAGTIAAGDHNHDSDYADIAHNHDSDYADISHNHDSSYGTINQHKIQSLTASGATTTANLNNGWNMKVELQANTAIDFTNPPSAGYCYHIPLYVSQNATGGYAITAWKVAGNSVTPVIPGGSITLTGTANSRDDLHCVLWNIGGTYYLTVKPAGEDIQ